MGSFNTKLRFGGWAAAALGFAGLASYSLWKQSREADYLQGLPKAEVSLLAPLGPYENSESFRDTTFVGEIPRGSLSVKVVDSSNELALIMTGAFGSPTRQYDLVSASSPSARKVGDSFNKLPQAIGSDGTIVGVKKNEFGLWIPYLESPLGNSLSLRSPFEKKFGGGILARKSCIAFSKIKGSLAFGTAKVSGDCSAFVFDLAKQSISKLPSITKRPTNLEVIDASGSGWVIGKELPSDREPSGIFVAWKIEGDGAIRPYRLDDILRSSQPSDDGTSLRIEVIEGFKWNDSIVAVCGRVDRRDPFGDSPIERGIYGIDLPMILKGGIRNIHRTNPL